MANEITDAFNAAFPDGPVLNPDQPNKLDIRSAGWVVQTQFDDLASVANGKWVPFATAAALSVSLNFADGTEARVYNDGANNGVYKKVGAAGTGSWTLVGPLPEGDTTALDQRATPYLMGTGPILDDRWNIFGGGNAIYIPKTLYYPRVFSVNLTPDTKLTNFYKVVVGLSSSAFSVYFDRLDNTVKVATQPTEIPSDPSRYFHILSSYGDLRIPSSSNMKVVEVHNSGAMVFASQAIVFDTAARKLRIPSLSFYSLGGGGGTLSPLSGQADREIDVPVQGGDISMKQVWVDIADLIKNGATSSTALKLSSGGLNFTNNPGVGNASGYTVLLGTIMNEKFHPGPNAHLPVAETVLNECGVGKDDNDLARYLYGGSRPVALNQPESLAMGFTKGYTTNSQIGGLYRVFYGDRLDRKISSGAAGYFYFHFYAESDTPNLIVKNVLSYAIDEAGQPVGLLNAHAQVIKILSSRVVEIEGWGRLTGAFPANPDIVGMWAGFDLDSADQWRLFGLQYAFKADGVSWPYISHTDYPRRASTTGNRLASLEAAGPSNEPLFAPIIPDRLYAMDGRPFSLFPDQMLSGLSSGGRYRLAMSSAPVASNYKPPLSVQRDGGDGVTLRAEDFRQETYRFNFIDMMGSEGTAYGKDVAIKKVTSAHFTGLTKKVLAIGDSITDWNGTITRTIRRMNDLGATITTIGTLSMVGNGGTLDAALTGEARSGKEYADYTYQNTTTISPVAVGGEAAYLAMDETDSGKRSKMPFLRAATGSDSSDRVFNGYIFDMRFYLNRFSLADPDLVYVNLGTNDITLRSLADARNHIVNAVRIIATQTRLALPTAKIVFGWHTLGRRTASQDGDVRWRDAHTVCLRDVVAYLRTLNDPNVFLFPAYCQVSRDMAFPFTETSDTTSGLVTRVQNDLVHHSDWGVDQFGEAAAITFAGIMAGI